MHRIPSVVGFLFSAPRRMTVVGLIALTVSASFAPIAVQAGGGLIENQHAQRFGLTRAWFSQAQLDPTRHKVERAVLSGDLVVVLTTAGVLHAMDAETGKTVWITRIGNPDHPSLGPAINETHIAIVNGSTLFILQRSDGAEVLHRQLGGGAGGGPALTDEYAFVPMYNGKIEAYSLTDAKQPAWYYASAGRIFAAPLATPDSVVWPTDRGYLYVANSAANGVRYRFESSSPLVAEPAAKNGVLYVSAADGYIYALNEQTGTQRWRYSTGAPIVRAPEVIGNHVFAATEYPSLHCINTADGTMKWIASDVRQLVSVSASRVYGINRAGDITILDKSSGVPQGRLNTNGTTTGILNSETDRLYLLSSSGLVQCLHEIGADEPLRHRESVPEAEADDATVEQPAEQPAVEQPAPEEKPADVVPFGEGDDNNPFANPFGTPDNSGDGEANPFANPFGP